MDKEANLANKLRKEDACEKPNRNDNNGGWKPNEGRALS